MKFELTMSVDKLRIASSAILVCSIAFITCIHGLPIVGGTSEPDTTTAAMSATLYEEMTTSLTTQTSTTPSVSKREKTTTFNTTRHETPAAPQEETTASESSQAGSSATTQLVPSLDQNTTVPIQSLLFIAGNSISLPCSSPVKTLLTWTYCCHDTGETKALYNGVKVNLGTALQDRVSESGCDMRKCSIHVRNLQLDDAGTFTCNTRGVDKGFQKRWSITILESKPTCRTITSLPGHAVDIADDIEIQCSVTFDGVWTPVFLCTPGSPGISETLIRQTSQTVQTNLTIETNETIASNETMQTNYTDQTDQTEQVQTFSSYVLYRHLIAAADVEDFTVFNCSMTFRLSEDIVCKDIPSESELPFYEFQWKSPAIRIVNASEWLDAYTGALPSSVLTTIQPVPTSELNNTHKSIRKSSTSKDEKPGGLSLLFGGGMLTIITASFICLLTTAIVAIVALVYCHFRRMRIVADRKSPAATTSETRALPQVPDPDSQTSGDRPHPDVPRTSGQDDGHYTDIHSILRGRVGGGRAVQSIADYNGHYSDIRSLAGGRDSGFYHYLDIDQMNAARAARGQPTADPGSGDQAVRPPGYEGLDTSDLTTSREPPRPHGYEGLGAGQAATSTQQTTEEIEMTGGHALPETTGDGLDPHGYLVVVGDPAYGDQTQGEGPRRGKDYEGLDPADVESLQNPPPPHDYAGLGTQAPGAGLDEHGYLVVVADPKYGAHPQPQEERVKNVDNSAAVSAAFTDASSPHHSAGTEAAAGDQAVRQTTGNKELEMGNGNKKSNGVGGYEGLDPREVEEARLRAQRPAEYAPLQGRSQGGASGVTQQENGNTNNGNGGGYEGLDPREVEEARLRAQRPAVYVPLQGRSQGGASGVTQPANVNTNNGNGGGYEGLDPQGVEEARLRAQRPAEYALLQGRGQGGSSGVTEPENENERADGGGGYEGLDPREVEEARLRAQRPAVYARLQGENVEDLYSVPKKKH